MSRNGRTADKASIAECTEPILQRKRMSRNGRTTDKASMADCTEDWERKLIVLRMQNLITWMGNKENKI